MAVGIRFLATLINLKINELKDQRALKNENTSKEELFFVAKVDKKSLVSELVGKLKR